MRQLSVLAAVLLAGCIAAPGPAPPSADGAPSTDWAAAALVSGHDHNDPALHNATTPNFHVVGYSPLVSALYGTTIPGTLCGDWAEREGRRLAVAQGRNDIVATIVDITDSANPQWLGELTMRTTYVYDVAMVADGRYAVLVTTNVRQPDQGPLVSLDAAQGSGLWWRSACAPGSTELAAAPGDDLLPRPNQVVLVNVEDPAQPSIVHSLPLRGEGHSVSSALVGGKPIVVTSGLVPLQQPIGSSAYAQSFDFFEVLATPTGGALRPLSAFSPPIDPAQPRLGSGHNDAWIAEHPLLRKPLAYLAAGDAGLVILDVSDPSQPQMLGGWNDHDPARPDDTGSHHSIYPMPTLWADGRHYTVEGPEFGAHPAQHPSGVVHVLDTTDPAEPKEVAAWTLPHDIVWEEFLQFSTHYLGVVDQTLFVSMYHGGLWAVDLRGIAAGTWKNLPSVGVFLPNAVSPKPPERPFRWAPALEEALPLPDGNILTFDSNVGLYIVRFDATRPMPPPSPWPLEPAKVP